MKRLVLVVCIATIAFAQTSTASAHLTKEQKIKKSQSVLAWYKGRGAWSLRPGYRKCSQIKSNSAAARCYRHRQNVRWHTARLNRLAPKPAATAAYTAPYPWHQIAMCESSLGRDAPQWHINTGNGFYGGLQFLTSTWLSSGGGKYAPRADLATPQQQVAIASTLALTHWPRCGAPYR